MDLIRLAAFDAEDLEVISAHLQDAIVRIGDIQWLPGDHRFTLIANRFNWLDAHRRVQAGNDERRRSGLRLERVLKVQAHRVRQDAKDAFVQLLAISFEKGEDPAGVITLVFADGAAIRLDVECIEVAMADLGPAWPTKNRPAHEVDDEIQEKR